MPGQEPSDTSTSSTNNESNNRQDRIRTLRACSTCSARKVKCDGQDECASCRRLGVSCVYVNSGKKRGPPKGSPARGGKRKKSDAAPLHTDTGSRIDSKSASVERRTSIASAPVTVPTPSLPTPSLPTPSLPTPTLPTLDTSTGIDAALDSVPVPTEVRFADDFWGDLLNYGPLSPLNATGLSLPQHPKVVDFVSPAPPLAAASTPGASSVAGSIAQHAGLSDNSIDRLLLIYETFIQPTWPIIYLPALRSLRSLETESPLVFDAILAMASAHWDVDTVPEGIFLGDPSRTANLSPLTALSETLIESVRQRILASFSLRPELGTVQALLLVTLVDFGYGRTSLAYQMAGIASRMAIDLGLHSQGPVGGMSVAGTPQAGDIRRQQEQCRTLWACFIIDKILAASLQRPPLLRHADIDTPRISTMERDEMDLWLAGGAAQHFVQPHAVAVMEQAKTHALTSFNAWCDVMCILETILDEVYRPAPRRARMSNQQAAGYDEVVAYIDTELRRWRVNLPQHLRWTDDTPAAHANIGTHILTMRGWYHACMLLLHRPRVPYLDTTASPDTDAIEALQQLKRAPDTGPSHHHVRLPQGVDASRHAATGICTIMEAYEQTFRVRKFPSSWVYLAFQAATVHAGLASRCIPDPRSVLLSARTDPVFRFEQCLRWLEQISVSVPSARTHVDILRKLYAVGARTRPPSPAPDHPQSQSQTQARTQTLPPISTAVVPSSSVSQPSTALSFDANPNPSPIDPQTLPPLEQSALIDNWMLFWASMPIGSDDASLWQSFNEMFNL